MAFIFRILHFVFFFAIYAALLGLMVFVISRAIQQVGSWMGYEIGSLWDWLKSKIPRFPKIKKKK